MFKDKCTKCAFGCKPEDHLIEKCIIKKDLILRTYNWEELIHYYRNSEGNTPIQKVLNGIKYDYNLLEQHIFQIQIELALITKQLNDLAMNKEPDYTVFTYFKKLIQKEEKEKKPFYEERIKVIQLQIYMLRFLKNYDAVFDSEPN